MGWVRWAARASRRDHRHPRQPTRPRGGPGERREAPRRGDLVPRRRGRLRRRPRRLHRAGPRALRRLPGRQPRPRGARRARHLILLGDRRRRGRVDQGERSASRRSSSSRELAPTAQRKGIGLFHASPRDPVWEYVLSIEQAECLDGGAARAPGADRPLPRRALLHPPAAGRAASTTPAAARPSDGLKLELGEGRWLLNPGSVGQPRDGDPRAAWLELDTEKRTCRYHRVAYDIDRAAASIVDGGAAETPRRPPPYRTVTRQLQAKLGSQDVV